MSLSEWLTRQKVVIMYVTDAKSITATLKPGVRRDCSSPPSAAPAALTLLRGPFARPQSCHVAARERVSTRIYRALYMKKNIQKYKISKVKNWPVNKTYRAVIYIVGFVSKKEYRFMYMPSLWDLNFQHFQHFQRRARVSCLCSRQFVYIYIYI